MTDEKTQYAINHLVDHSLAAGMSMEEIADNLASLPESPLKTALVEGFLALPGNQEQFGAKFS